MSSSKQSSRFSTLRVFKFAASSSKPPPPPPKDGCYLSPMSNRSMASLSPDSPQTPLSPLSPRREPNPRLSYSTLSLVSTSATEPPTTRPKLKKEKSSSFKDKFWFARKSPRTPPVPSPKIEDDEGISLPWNVQHQIHVDDTLLTLPPSWTASLSSAGFTEDEIAAIRARRTPYLFTDRPNSPSPPVPVLTNPLPRTTSLPRTYSGRKFSNDSSAGTSSSGRSVEEPPSNSPLHPPSNPPSIPEPVPLPLPPPRRLLHVVNGVASPALSPPPAYDVRSTPSFDYPPEKQTPPPAPTPSTSSPPRPTNPRRSKRFTVLPPRLSLPAPDTDPGSWSASLFSAIPELATYPPPRVVLEKDEDALDVATSAPLSSSPLWDELMGVLQARSPQLEPARDETSPTLGFADDDNERRLTVLQERANRDSGASTVSASTIVRGASVATRAVGNLRIISNTEESTLLSPGIPSASTPSPLQRYRGWLSDVVAPLEEFIDEAVDPRAFYTDLCEIAEGESGSVYAATVHDPLAPALRLPAEAVARDTALLARDGTVRVAIKSVAIVPAGSPKLGDLRRELGVMRGVVHGHILGMEKMYVDLVEDCLWIRMELMERSLADVVGLVGEGLMVQERMIARFASDVLCALEYLETQYIAHRDLRSDNLLLNSEGVLKLADFSNAVRVTPECPTCSEPAGVIYWQAPEMRNGAEYSAMKVDAWSLGATAWEMAESEPPFSGENQPLGARWPPLSRPEIYSPAFHEFLRMCSQPAASRPAAGVLAQTAFVRNACGRAVIVQLLSQCVAIERARQDGGGLDSHGVEGDSS